jgi:hypothetical protein
VALYRLEVTPIQRGKGKSAVAASAYRAGERLTIGGQVWDYRRRHGVLMTMVITPDGAEWARDRQTLWSTIETHDSRKNARTAIELDIALPHELSAGQRMALAHRLARELAAKHQTAVDLALHAPGRERFALTGTDGAAVVIGGDERNYHAHLLMPTWSLTPDGPGDKLKLLDTPAKLEAIRARWAELLNAALERHQVEARVDHRSYVRQGIDRIAGVHVGRPALTLAARDGIVIGKVEKMLALHEAESIRRELAEVEKQIAAEREAETPAQTVQVVPVKPVRILEIPTRPAKPAPVRVVSPATPRRPFVPLRAVEPEQPRAAAMVARPQFISTSSTPRGRPNVYHPTTVRSRSNADLVAARSVGGTASRPIGDGSRGSDGRGNRDEAAPRPLEQAAGGRRDDGPAWHDRRATRAASDAHRARRDDARRRSSDGAPALGRHERAAGVDRRFAGHPDWWRRIHAELLMPALIWLKDHRARANFAPAVPIIRAAMEQQRPRFADQRRRITRTIDLLIEAQRAARAAEQRRLETATRTRVAPGPPADAPSRAPVSAPSRPHQPAPPPRPVTWSRTPPAPPPPSRGLTMLERLEGLAGAALSGLSAAQLLKERLFVLRAHSVLERHGPALAAADKASEMVERWRAKFEGLDQRAETLLAQAYRDAPAAAKAINRGDPIERWGELRGGVLRDRDERRVAVAVRDQLPQAIAECAAALAAVNQARENLFQVESSTPDIVGLRAMRTHLRSGLFSRIDDAWRAREAHDRHSGQRRDDIPPFGRFSSATADDMLVLERRFITPGPGLVERLERGNEIWVMFEPRDKPDERHLVPHNPRQAVLIVSEWRAVLLRDEAAERQSQAYGFARGLERDLDYERGR